MKNISVLQLVELLKSKEPIQLIDTREAEEHADFNIGGTLIPLADITKQLEQIDMDKKVVLYCRKGVRSQIAIQRLQQKFPFLNLYNLTGGMEAWKKQVS